MKRIMFNDRYGLTRAVLDGKKTMTRCIIPLTDADGRWLDTAFDFDFREMVIIDQYSRFKVGEELAVAQRYWDLRSDNGFYEALQRADPSFPLECIRYEKGCHNKMFVRAEWMPHRIRITDIKAERLQDISEEDAMREGIFKYDEPPLHHEADMFAPWAPYVRPYKWDSDNLIYRCTARYAFAYLIDKISGKGTWNRNPWVFAYEFELTK